MADEQRVLQSLGMALRAGKIVMGDEAVLKTVQARLAALVLIASDASDKTKKKYRDKCRTYQVPLLELGLAERIGSALGQPPRVVVGVTDAGFSSIILKHYQANL
jgi:ribosomal protein L7Ae-like RNA K-turn-binding protein